MGDWIVTEFPGGSPRRGRILRTFGSGQHIHFDVLWNDSHESLLYPDPSHSEIIPAGIRTQHDAPAP